MAAPIAREIWPSLKLNRLIVIANYDGSFIRLISSDDVNKQTRFTRQSSLTSGDQSTKTSDTSNINGRLSHLMQAYEDFVGLTEVKHAQTKVVDAESQFLQVQENRRAMQQDLVAVQTEVRSLANDLEKTHRTDPCYIDLVKKEHEILLVEKDMTSKIKALDKAERDYFSLLSAAVRESHEKERARAERTKYWSVIGSVIGALIGITGSTWNNRMRLKEMRAIATASGEMASEYKEVADQLISNISHLQNKTVANLPVKRNEYNDSSAKALSQDNLQQFVNEQTDLFTQMISEQTNVLLSNMNDVKKILSVHHASIDEKNVIYVGPDVKDLLRETERSLQNDIGKKMISISVLGCLLTVGLSFLITYVKGP